MHRPPDLGLPCFFVRIGCKPQAQDAALVQARGFCPGMGTKAGAYGLPEAGSPPGSRPKANGQVSLPGWKDRHQKHPSCFHGEACSCYHSSNGQCIGKDGKGCVGKDAWVLSPQQQCWSTDQAHCGFSPCCGGAAGMGRGGY